MKNFFHHNNPLWDRINRVFDYFLLSLLWVICSIPLLTIGIATSSLFYASFKLLNEQDDRIFRNFFHSFRVNFVQATVLWLIVVIFFGFLLLDYNLCLHYYTQLPELAFVAFFMLLAFGVLFLFILHYLFPLQCRYQNTVLHMILNAVTLSVHHFGYTLLMLIIDIAALLLALFVSGMFLLFIPGILAFGHGWILNRIFQQYQNEA